MPYLYEIGVQSFPWTCNVLSVLCGLNAVLILSGASNSFDTSCKHGRTTVALGSLFVQD